MSFSITRSRRNLTVAAALATAALGFGATQAHAFTMQVRASAIACCAADTTIKSVGWSVAGPTASVPHPTFSKFVVNLPVDVNSFEFYRMTALATPIDEVDLTSSTVNYCTSGDKLVNMATNEDGTETLTFSFNTLAVSNMSSKGSAFGWNTVTNVATAAGGVCGGA